MSRYNNRLLLELDKFRRELNRETISPLFENINVETFAPIAKTCAKARADYVNCLIGITSNEKEGVPDQKQIDQLRQFRIAYEELVSAANAMETVIERGYVDAEQN